MKPKEPIFLSDGEVDPVSHIEPPEPPRVIRDGYHPIAVLAALIVLVWGALGVLWLLAIWILT